MRCELERHIIIFLDFASCWNRLWPGLTRLLSCSSMLLLSWCNRWISFCLLSTSTLSSLICRNTPYRMLTFPHAQPSPAINYATATLAEESTLDSDTPACLTYSPLEFKREFQSSNDSNDSDITYKTLAMWSSWLVQVILISYSILASFPPNLFLLRLHLGLEAADLLLGQRHGVLLLLEGPKTKLEVGHLPLQLHDPGALRHRGHLRQDVEMNGGERGDEAGERSPEGGTTPGWTWSLWWGSIGLELLKSRKCLLFDSTWWHDADYVTSIIQLNDEKLHAAMSFLTWHVKCKEGSLRMQ